MEKNYQVSRSKIDVVAEVDNKLSMKENWFKLKERVLALSPKEKVAEENYKDVETYYLECARIEVEEHKCSDCNAPFEKMDKHGYEWKPMCKHYPKGLRLMIG